jgi:hypothetical protein
MVDLPPYVTREVIAERLPLIFPEGTEHRKYCIRELAASTVFAALYIGAIEGANRYFGPVHVYRMTSEQAAKADDDARRAYDFAITGKKPISGSRWYADNTREPIRDETLRDGLVHIGAVLRREDLPTTSGAPKYALGKDFAGLFHPALDREKLERGIADFQSKHLSKSAQARLAIIRTGATTRDTAVLVNFPNGETRQLAPGPSSMISKAVVEEFSTRFLDEPAVLWLSESGNKVVVRDERVAKAIGLKIEAERNLPDLILADLRPEDPLIVFVEVVATDGAVTARRRNAFYELTDRAGFNRKQIIAVTAYEDRQSSGFKKTVTELAWGTLAWFVSEPDHLITFHETLAGRKLSALSQIGS